MKGPLTFNDLFGVITILVVNASAGSPMVLSRYYIILIPLLYLYFFNGVNYISSFFPKVIKCTIFLVVSGLMLGNLLSINCRAVYSAKHPYPPAIQSYIKSAIWVKSNVDKDAIIGSRKSSLYYIWSDRQSLHFFDGIAYSRNDVWSQKFESDTLKYYKSVNMDYIILDSFLPDSWNKILPVVQHNPELFEIVYSPAQFNIPENQIKNINQVVAIYNNYYRKNKNHFVPTVVLRIKK